MRSQLRFTGKLAFLGFALLLAQCGGKSKSSEVNISITPTNPIVFTNDFTYTDGGGNSVTVKGPWFSFTVQIDNESTDPIVLIGLETDVTGTSVGTGSVVTTQFVAPSDNISTDTLTCTYSDYGQFEKAGTTGNSGTIQKIPDAGETGCPAGPKTFYAGGNPTPTSTASIRYTVVIKPIGYFGTRGAPTDRFTGQTTVYTQ